MMARARCKGNKEKFFLSATAALDFNRIETRVEQFFVG
jgi:hypothetical protein